MGCLFKKTKKYRPPLRPREGPYKKTNAYTSRPCLEQIITAVLVLILIILHAVFVISGIARINHEILWIMLAFHFALMLFVIILYFQITIFDPVDRYILNPKLATRDMYKVYCQLCQSFTEKRSYHCKRCNRCTENFDHHCKFLNNCIGGRNYHLFLSIVILFIVFNMNCIGQTVWVLVECLKKKEVADAVITEWMCIPILLLSSALLLLTTTLCVFHFYISLCLDLSTVEFYQTSDNASQKPRISGNEGGGFHMSDERLGSDNFGIGMPRSMEIFRNNSGRSNDESPNPISRVYH